jgi:hypothetical protein
MRMNPDRRIYERILVRELNPGIQNGWTISVADGDHRLHPRFSCASDHLLAIGVKLFAIEMSV